MGLKKLLTDLKYRTEVSNTPLGSDINFKQKSLSFNDGYSTGPLIGRVSWDTNEKNANPVFLLGEDHGKGGLDGGGLRGGIATNMDRRTIDHARISGFLGDSIFQWPLNINFPSDYESTNTVLNSSTEAPTLIASETSGIDISWRSPFAASSVGQQFKWRQIGLQRMNPKINAPMEPGIESFSPANQRTYLPISTKTSVRLAGVSQIKREGTTLGLFGNGYEDDKDFLETSNKNRLIYLYNNKITIKEPKDEKPFKDQSFTEKLNTIGDYASSVMNFVGGKGEMLYDYNGGPNSIFGIGRTFIGRYTNTNPKGIENAYRENFQYLETQNPFIEKEKGRLVKKGNIREEIYGEIKYDEYLTKYIAKDNHPSLTKGQPTYNVSSNVNGVDKINALNIFKTQDGSDWEKEIFGNTAKDFIPFQFEVIDIDNPIQSTKIVFRAYIDSITDDYSTNHNEVKYSGRAEKFYTYNEFNRNINITFKIAALSRMEMEPIYRKLNYLVAQTAPNYKGTRMRTPYMKLTVGDWFNRLPGVLSNVSLNWSKDYPWEIKLDPESQDSEMLQLPHVLDVSISFLPIHKMRPENEVKTPFINIDKWLSYGAADFSNFGDYTPEMFRLEKFSESFYPEDEKEESFIEVEKQSNYLEPYKTEHNLDNGRFNTENIVEINLPSTTEDKEESFTQRWNKFKEKLSNEGALGINKTDLENLVK